MMKQSALIDDNAGGAVVLHPDELGREAMAVFQDTLATGCSLADCITAVYAAGLQRSGQQAPTRPKRQAVPPCPYDAIVAIYHAELRDLPGVRVMDDARKRLIRDRWAWVLSSSRPDGSRRAQTHDEGLGWFLTYFRLASKNDFLMGKDGRTGAHAKWKADIDFLMSSRGLKHVMERTDDGGRDE